MKKVRKMSLKRVATFTMAAAVAVTSFGLTGCGTGSSDEQVIIYSNADEEAITAMENALDNNGYEGKYMFQTFGTSELGGKLLAEGKDIEADMVTMSTFYVESVLRSDHISGRNDHCKYGNDGRKRSSDAGIFKGSC